LPDSLRNHLGNHVRNHPNPGLERVGEALTLGPCGESIAYRNYPEQGALASLLGKCGERSETHQHEAIASDSKNNKILGVKKCEAF